MEGEAFNVKTEPKEDLQYNIYYEEDLEIKAEMDLPIKSEESFKEEVHDYQQPECCPESIALPPIKEDLLERHRLNIRHVKELHRLNIRHAEELHRLEMERLRLKVEFDAEMRRETLQAAKEKREREIRHSEEIRRAHLRNLQGPSEHTE